MTLQFQTQIYVDPSSDLVNHIPSSPDKYLSSPSDSKANCKHTQSALAELNAETLHNIRNKHARKHTLTPHDKRIAPSDGSVTAVTPESLAKDLENFHIHSPEKNGNTSVVETSIAETNNHCDRTVAFHSLAPRSAQIGFNQKRARFRLSECSENDPEEPGSTASDLVKQQPDLSLSTVPDTRLALERHDAKKFDWVLSLPCTAGDFVKGARSTHPRRTQSTADVADVLCEDRKVYFGCNLLQHRSRSGSDLTGQQHIINTYTLVASPLGVNVGPEPFAVQESASTKEATSMVDTSPAPERTALAVNNANGEQIHASPRLLGEGLEGGFSRHRSPSTRSHSSSVSRIEDTFEELDRLEDQFEAVNSMVHVDRVPSPDKAVTANPAQAAPGSAKKPLAKTLSVRGRGKALETPQKAGQNANSVKPKSTPGQAKRQSVLASSPAANTTNKRASMARLASLQPPKPPAKSTKPPTIPTFELPGDAVARRLKEQREKRMSMALAATEAPAPAISAPRRTRSTKPPTRPAFELPGEAISRRKREEHEAKLRQQEEEERKRREFKARPIRASIAPSTYPRDTATSRARQNRMSMVGDSSTGNKRLSLASAASSSLSSGQNAVRRGRGSALETPSVNALASRTQSTSTGSVSGKRSTMSTDDVEQQKIRGKEVCHRDNLLSVDRNREKRDREAIAKQARQEAAERSRMLSREWAEKQKQRAKKLMAAAAKVTA